MVLICGGPRDRHNEPDPKVGHVGSSGWYDHQVDPCASDEQLVLVYFGEVRQHHVYLHDNLSCAGSDLSYNICHAVIQQPGAQRPAILQPQATSRTYLETRQPAVKVILSTSRDEASRRKMWNKCSNTDLSGRETRRGGGPTGG